MTKGKWLVGFGVFLFVCGAAAYLANPTQAPTPLLAGAVGGGLIAMLGVMASRGRPVWAITAATMLVIVFMMLALAMTMQHGLLYYRGESTDLISPVLDALVAVAAGITLRMVKKNA
ncbi:hypothetical protein OVA24_15835 [Luteolibacter sp. SL250]|uniref:hypothetical protein n=1 Tax=Luteolibacter sp. SL250 TaxID=2995170 RepID=UPI00226FC220|nr:hypothetical protein [Luteolibacter sp. SL250]WAC18700.1 hypothetical protein OVA24_15835 [Luteolibacter sp. SL250]